MTEMSDEYLGLIRDRAILVKEINRSDVDEQYREDVWEEINNVQNRMNEIWEQMLDEKVPLKE